jgi:hypothetical protein
MTPFIFQAIQYSDIHRRYNRKFLPPPVEQVGIAAMRLHKPQPADLDRHGHILYKLDFCLR